MLAFSMIFHSLSNVMIIVASLCTFPCRTASNS